LQVLGEALEMLGRALVALVVESPQVIILPLIPLAGL
jgi:hypothetical protein